MGCSKYSQEVRARGTHVWPYLTLLVAVIAAGLLFVRPWEGRESSGEDADDSKAIPGRWTAEMHGPSPSDTADGDAPDGQITTIEGHVFDALAAGAPIAGARVCGFVRSPIHGRPLPPRCVRTDAQGLYRLDVPASWRPFVAATAPGRRSVAPDGVGESDALAATHTGALDFHLIREGVWVEGVVSDAMGGVVAGAEVFTILSDPRHPPAIGLDGAVTDASGHFELWLAAGHGALGAIAPGYGTASRWDRYPAPDLRVALAPEARIEGIVVDGRTGAPITDAEVTAGGPWGPDRASTDAAVRSDESGHFVLAGLSPGRYRVSARAAGAYGEATQTIQLGMGETHEGLTIEAVPAGDVFVRVHRQTPASTDPDRGQACRWGSVELVEHAGRPWSSSTGEDGVAALIGVLPGIYDVVVDCEGQQGPMPWPTLTVRDGARTELVVELSAGHTVEGRVVDGRATPVAGVTVSLNQRGTSASGEWSSGSSLPSDEDGRFSITGLLAVDHEVTVRGAAVVAGGPQPPPLTLDRAPLTQGVMIVIGRGAVLRGRVVDREGRGVSHLYVVARDRGRVVATAMTDAAGAFELGSMFPGDVEVGVYRTIGNAWIDAVASPYAGERARLQRARRSAATTPMVTAQVIVSLDANPEIELGVDVRRGKIEGCVVDEDGQAIPGAWVWAQAGWDRGGPGGESRGDPNDGANVEFSTIWVAGVPPIATDKDGCAVLSDAAEGWWELIAQDARGASGGATGVRIGAKTEIVVRRGGSVEGTVMGAHGPLTQFAVVMRGGEPDRGWARLEEFVSPRGVWRIDRVPVGVHSVWIESIEGSMRHTVKVERDGVARVETRLAGSASLSGRVLDIDATPLLGAVVRVTTLEMDSRFAMSARPVTTGADGRFEFAAVAPGSLSISVVAPPQDPRAGRGSKHAAPITVSAGPGQHASTPDIAVQWVE